MSKYVPILDPIYGLPVDPLRGKVFIGLIEVVASNGNGNPDEAGKPRMDSQDRHFIRDAALKRRVRDAAKIQGAKLWMDHGVNLQRSFDPYIRGDVVAMDEAYADLWDLRLFGGTATVEGRGKTWKGQPIRNVGAGPLQMTRATSLDPVNIAEVGLTRVAHGKESADGDARANMGRQYMVDYALCRFHGEYLPSAAHGMVTADDLSIFFRALIESCESSRSAARMGVNLRKLFVFDFPVSGSRMEPKHVMQSRVIAQKDPDVLSPTKLGDYEIGVDTNGLPGDVQVYTWNDGEVEVVPQGSRFASVERTFSI